MKLTICILTFLLFSLIAFGQTTSPDFDTTYAQQLDTELLAIGDALGAKGLTAAVHVPGQGTWVGTYGIGDTDTPVTTDMRFGVASNTKAIIGGLILKLQDEELLSIDDPINIYLDNYENIDSNITIKQLLYHTSGLFDYINDWTATTSSEYATQLDSIWTSEDLLNTIGDSLFFRGHRHSYSNTNYLLLGMVAEAITGTPMHELLQEKVFGPTNVTMAYPPADDIFAAPHSRLFVGDTPELSATDANGFLSFPSTAGGVWSTAYDMVQWYDQLFNSDFLSKESKKNLVEEDGYIAYGAGVRFQNILGRSIYYHEGAWGFHSYMAHEPRTGISMCLLSNQQGTSVDESAINLLATALNNRPKANYDISVDLISPDRNQLGPPGTFTLTATNHGLEAVDEVIALIFLDDVYEQTVNFALSELLQPDSTISLSGQLNFWDELMNSSFNNYGFRIRVDTRVGQPSLDEYPNDNSDFSNIVNPNFLSGFLDFYYGCCNYYNAYDGLLKNGVYEENNNNLLNWEMSKTAYAITRNNYWDSNIGAKYSFETVPLHLHYMPMLFFAYAHASYSGTEMDDLRIYISTDLGESFTLLDELIDDDFITAPATTEPFLPQNTDWVYYNKSLEEYLNTTVIIKFELENDNGNMAYISDLGLYNSLSTDDLDEQTAFALSPNPAINSCQVSIKQDHPEGQINLVNTTGQLIYQVNIEGQKTIDINTSDLPGGMYYIQYINEQHQIRTEKLVLIGE